MEPITRQVRDIDAAERRVLEHVIGRQLGENEQVIVQVVTPGKDLAEESRPEEGTPGEDLPEWCNVYDGLSEEEIDDLESIILERANLTRPSD